MPEKADPPLLRSVSSRTELFSPQELVFDFDDGGPAGALTTAARPVPRRSFESPRLRVREKIRRWLEREA